MSNISKALAAVGFAKQSAFGSPAANPAYLLGVRSGSPMKVAIDQTPEDRTSMDYRGTSEINRNKVVHSIEIECRAHAASIGLLLYGALGGYSVTGAGPYTHVFTPAQDLPYFTFWGLLGGSNIFSLQDARIDSLEVSWTEAERLIVKLSAIGATPGFPSSITPGLDEQRAASFQAGGGQFKVATIGSSPITAPVKAGSFTIKNSLVPVQLSTSVVPQDVAVGHQGFETKLTLIPANLNPWREIDTGSTGGTTVAEQPVYGSYDVKCVMDANTDLDVVAPKVAFATDLPQADPAGGPAEIDLVGEPVRPASGAAFTATLRNSIATY